MPTVAATVNKKNAYRKKKKTDQVTKKKKEVTANAHGQGPTFLWRNLRQEKKNPGRKWDRQQAEGGNTMGKT